MELIKQDKLDEALVKPRKLIGKYNKCMLLKELSEEVHNVLKQDNFFITIGGDHSSGIGSWSAAAATYREQGDIGLIWFDAHLDAHTYETTPSGNIHGMPVACLLGYGKDELTSIMYPGAKIKPENLVFVGARSYEQGEHDLLQDLGVKIYYMDEINQRGLAPIFEEAKAQVKRNTVAYGLSLDLDGIDPEQAPGVGTPAANGVDAQELITALECFAYDPKLIGAELVEFNPNLDSDSKTENIVLALLEQLYRSQERVIF